jgi:hypothetical protein
MLLFSTFFNLKSPLLQFSLARIFHESVSRDREDGCATRSAGACAACRVTAGGRTRGVLEQYVAGFDTRGRPEGQSYPRSQQAIRETYGLATYFQIRPHPMTLVFKDSSE